MIVVGVPDKIGAGTTVSVTLTVKLPDPILRSTLPVNVPADSCAFMFEAVIVMLVVAPAFNVPVVGLAKSQLVPLLVCALEENAPEGPQLVIVTICVAGSLTLATPLNASEFGLPFTQPACTVNITGNDSVTLFGWPVNVSVTE